MLRSNTLLACSRGTILCGFFRVDVCCHVVLGVSEKEHFLTVAGGPISHPEHSDLGRRSKRHFLTSDLIVWSHSKNTIQEPLFIVTDIARDDEALQAATRVNNPKCKGMTGRY
jgi:hypothetical protein